MIEIQNISLDEESNLYVEEFFNHSNDPQEFKIIESNLNKVKKSHSMATLNSQIFCYRCGKSGHISGNCNEELPNLQELETEMFEDLKNEIKSLEDTGLYQKDEFGLFLDSDNAVKLNLYNTEVCLNCGQPGHSISQCSKPNISLILKKMGDLVSPQSSASAQEIESMFRRIYRN